MNQFDESTVVRDEDGKFSAKALEKPKDIDLAQPWLDQAALKSALSDWYRAYLTVSGDDSDAPLHALDQIVTSGYALLGDIRAGFVPVDRFQNGELERLETSLDRIEDYGNDDAAANREAVEAVAEVLRIADPEVTEPDGPIDPRDQGPWFVMAEYAPDGMATVYLTSETDLDYRTMLRCSTAPIQHQMGYKYAQHLAKRATKDPDGDFVNVRVERAN